MSLNRHKLEQAKHHLLTAFNILAPDAAVQTKLTHEIFQLEREGTSLEDICHSIAGSILDLPTQGDE